jgi:hypothetical protein
MPFEEVMFQYGLAGAVIVWLIYDRAKFLPVITTAINNNTIAMTKVYEVMNHCKNNKLKGGLRK